MKEQKKDAFIDRIQQGVASQEASTEADSRTAVDAPEKQDAGEFLSTLALRDRVVVMLLYNQVVRVEHVEDVWEQWKAQGEGEGAALWRFIAQHPEVDATDVFREAARVYAFEEAAISRYSAMNFLREHRGHFTDAQRRRMCELKIVPISTNYDDKQDPQWVFATHDPMNPEVEALLKELDLSSYKLKHAPEIIVLDLLMEGFPEQEHELDEIDRNELEACYAKSREDAEAPTPESLQQRHFLRKVLEEQERSEGFEKREAPEKSDRETALDFFERTLIEGVRAGVNKVYLFPNAEQQTEVHFSVDGTLRQHAIEDELPAEFVLTFIKNEIFKQHRTDAEPVNACYDQRWIDGKQVRYRVSLNKVQDRERGIRTQLVVLHILE